MFTRCGKRISKHEDGSVDHEMWTGHWHGSKEGPKYSEYRNGYFTFTRRERALAVMRYFERNGRTDSAFYRAAQSIALEKWLGKSSH